MKVLLFDNYSYLLGQFVTFLFSISFYFKIHYYTTLVSTKANREAKTLKKYKIFRKSVILMYFRWLIVAYTGLMVWFWLLHGVQKNIFFSKYRLTNFSTLLSLVLSALTACMFLILKNVSKVNLNTNLEFYFSINMTTLTACMVYWSNDLLVVFLHLELLAFFFFYTLSVSKFWAKSQSTGNSWKGFQFFKNQTAAYVNLLFYYYWTNFFGSVLILYSYINICANYGTTDLLLIEPLYLTTTDSGAWFFEVFTWVAFQLGFLIKIGLAPFHFFKLEIYKGSTIFVLYFYSIFFFYIYVTLFIYLYLYYFSVIFSNWWYMWSILILLIGLWIVFAIFNVNYIKLFFAFSTILNTYVWIFCLTTQLI